MCFASSKELSGNPSEEGPSEPSSHPRISLGSFLVISSASPSVETIPFISSEPRVDLTPRIASASPGRYKLVQSRTQRKLTDSAAEDLSLYVDDDNVLYEKKMKGIGEIEKALKPDYTKKEINDILKEVTTKTEGHTILVPVTDKRKTIEGSIATDFDDLEL